MKWRGEKGCFSERVILVFCGALGMEYERGEMILLIDFAFNVFQRIE